MTKRLLAWPILGLILGGCQLPGPRLTASTPGGLAALAGEYDNRAQIWDAQTAAMGAAPEIPAIHQWLRPTPDGALLWRLASPKAAQEGRWLLREEGDAWVPYRPLDAAALSYFAGESDPVRFRFEPAAWAPLTACALQHADGGSAHRADAAACSALWSGLGEAAALLPLRVQVDGETIVVATVADAARGAGATTVSRRVRWFSGWDALAGGGAQAQAQASNEDWHVRRDLRLHSEGGRVELRWRDGAPSGYVLELARLTYRESGTEVLRLAVIETTGNRVLSYAWADPGATRIGINLGWLQVGLEQEGTGDSARR